ncbi:MAG TPA: CHAD domain-containing protein [Solirubrobacteraceae bacterium]|jgi:CHAD domain-containing protein
MEHPLKTAVLAAVAATSDQPDRKYRLRVDEYLPDGIRRIARGQLHNAHDDLSGASRRQFAEAVHETRKRLKRLRASVRLARDGIGQETYERENAAFRTAGRRLSAGRDAQVLVETIDSLSERFADELPERVTATLRARLEEERKHAEAAAQRDDAGTAAVLGELEQALTRTPAWTFQNDDFDALSPGLRRIYRRGRKRMRAARKDPTAENLHEWRKRVKDLWHATQIVRAAQPKRLKRVSRRAHKLADLLGDGHDLSMLREYVEAHPQCFEDKASRKALVAVIDRRSKTLRDKALKRGRRLYKRSPKRFVRAIERGWDKRAPDQPQRLAG